MAEFEALRAEIVSHLRSQAALVGLGLTGLGIIAGLAIDQNGNDRLLLAIPPLASLIVLVHTSMTFRLSVLGSYIRTTLWPYLESQVGEIPSWEAQIANRRGSLRAVPRTILIDFPAMTLFLFASVFALSQTVSCDGIWIFGCIVTLIAIAAPIWIGFGIFRSSGVRP